MMLFSDAEIIGTINFNVFAKNGALSTTVIYTTINLL